jgi:hypothetical protein
MPLSLMIDRHEVEEGRLGPDGLPNRAYRIPKIPSPICFPAESCRLSPDAMSHPTNKIYVGLVMALCVVYLLAAVLLPYAHALATRRVLA